MARIGSWLLIIFFAGISTQAAAQTNCHVPNFNVIHNGTVTGYMYVKPGRTCSVMLTNSLGGVKSVEVTKKPSNGSLELRVFGLRYIPRQGFVGKDTFSFRDHALDRYGNPVTHDIVMEVTVSP